MKEHVVVCAWSGARQTVIDDNLPHGWVEIPTLRHGDNADGEKLEDLHFVSYDALGQWAAARQLRMRNQATLRPGAQRVWQSDR